MAPAQATERGGPCGPSRASFRVGMPSHSTVVVTLDLRSPDFYKKNMIYLFLVCVYLQLVYVCSWCPWRPAKGVR